MLVRVTPDPADLLGQTCGVAIRNGRITAFLRLSRCPPPRPPVSAQRQQLPRLERLARMHYDLDINLEGIEAISHLLERVERMQHDLRALQEWLHLYEGER